MSHSTDWSEVRLHVAASGDAAVTEITVLVRPDGLLIPQRSGAQLGAEAPRIIATAVRAGQRSGAE